MKKKKKSKRKGVLRFVCFYLECDVFGYEIWGIYGECGGVVCAHWLAI